MKYVNLYSGLIFCILTISCSSFNQEKRSDKSAIVIRYLNLKTVYNSVLIRNKESRELKASIEKNEKIIVDLEEKLLNKKTGREKIIKDLKDKKEKLAVDKSKEAYLKAKIYNRINSAVKKIAKKLGADYILNIGDELIYSKKKYDITEEVIREILRLEKRRAPVSR